MKWFVYSNASYYPDAVLVDAESVEAVVEAVQANGYPSVIEGLAIFPLDALALWRGQQLSEGTEPIENALEVLP